MSGEKADTAGQETLTASSPKFVEGMVEEWSSFVPARRTLDDLSPEQAAKKLEGWPHSIAEVVAHMLFWQYNNFQTIETGLEPEVDEPAESWPNVTQDEWPRLRDEFLAALERSKAMARDPKLFEHRPTETLFVGVEVDRDGAGHSGSGGDFADAHTVAASSTEESRGCLENGVTGSGGVSGERFGDRQETVLPDNLLNVCSVK